MRGCFLEEVPFELNLQRQRGFIYLETEGGRAQFLYESKATFRKLDIWTPEIAGWCWKVGRYDEGPEWRTPTLYELFCLQVHYDPAAAAAESLQSCPPLCDPADGSPPGSPVPGILQARTLEWVAISFSNAWKWKVKVKSLSRVRLFVTPRTAAHQAPPSTGFSRQEHWSGVPLPSLHYDPGGSNMAILQGFFPICFSLFVMSFLPPLYAFLTALPFSLLYPLSSLFFLPNACPVTTGLISKTFILVEGLWTLESHFFNASMRRSVDICPVNWWKSLKKSKNIQSLRKWSKWHIANEETHIQEDLLKSGRSNQKWEYQKQDSGPPWWSSG